MVDRLFDLARERIGRLAEPLFYVWATASVALGLVLLVVRVVSGPVHGYWESAMAVVWGAPLWIMLLGFVGGWVWFALWLMARPFRPLRESRLMHPERW